MLLRNAASHADRHGHGCPSALAMQHSVDPTVASTVSHELLSSKHSLAGTARTAASGQLESGGVTPGHGCYVADAVARGPAVGDECDPQWRARQAEQNAGRRRRDAHLATAQELPGGGQPGPNGAARRRASGRLVPTPFARASKSGSSVSTSRKRRPVSWCWRSGRAVKSASSAPARNLIILTQGFWTNCRYVVGA